MARIFLEAGSQSLATIAQTITNFDSYSAAFWYYRTGTPAARRGIMSTGAWDITHVQTTNLVRAGFKFSTLAKERNSTTAPALNTWVHVLVTHKNTGFASTDFTFYFNGKSEAGTDQNTGSGTVPTASSALTVGDPFGAAPPANIGPIALWNRALSPAEALALAGGAHPLRFKEGLVEFFDMSTAHGEEGWLSKIYLAQGATNPSSAFVNPPMQYASRGSFSTQLNVRPMLMSRARYFVPSTGPITFSATPAIATWLVAASTVLAAAVSLPATPAIQSWAVPGASLVVARTLVATPAIQTWSVPAASIATTRSIAATPAIQTWNVPVAVLSAARSLASTPAIQTWSVPGGSIFAAGGPISFSPAPVTQAWSVPAAALSAARTLQPTPIVQTWATPPVTLAANRTLGASPAIQTWTVLNAGISNPGLTGIADFTGEVSIGPRFIGDAELAPYFSGVLGTRAQFQGVASIAARFSGLLLITPWFDGEPEVGPG